MKRMMFFFTVLLVLGFSRISWAQVGVGVDVDSNQQQELSNSTETSVKVENKVDTRQEQGVNNTIDFGDNTTGRQFANSPGLLPAIPSSAFVPLDNPYTYIDGKEFGMVSGWYTREMLENLTGGQKFDDINVVNYYGITAEERPSNTRILFMFGADKIPGGLYLVDQGTVNVKTKPDGETTSFGAIAQAGLEALEMGADAIVFFSQGAERKIRTKSLSIGLSGAGAGVPGEKAAANMVGGTGFGMGESGYRNPAWVHAYYGRLYSQEEYIQLWNEVK